MTLPNALTYATASVGISGAPTVASVTSCLDTAAAAVGSATAEVAKEMEYDFHYDAARQRVRAEQTRFVSDIFGDPFHSVAVNPSWFTSTVVSLAETIYSEKAFDRMPILADALEEAGCDHEDILSHCRSDGPHVKGCWVVDLVCGKS